MNGKLAIVTGSLVMALVACGADDGSQQGSAPCTSTTAEPPAQASATEPGDDPPPNSDVSDAGTTKKTPSPVDACEGVYSCGTCGSGEQKFWLHSDGVRCLFGGPQEGIVLHEDGSVTSSAGKRGTWSGDNAYFRLDYPSVCGYTGSGGGYSSRITCRREQ